MIDLPTTAPNLNGDRPLPRTNRPRTLVPSTWLDRTINIEHVVGGAVRQTSGVLADLYPAGPILNVNNVRTLISWDSIATVELVPD